MNMMASQITGVSIVYPTVCSNALRPRQSGRHFADAILKCIFLNENAWISLKISLKFVPKVRINNIPALVQIMAWRRPGNKPLSEPMMVSLLTHICVTRPQWVKHRFVHSHLPLFKYILLINYSIAVVKFDWKEKKTLMQNHSKWHTCW